MKMADGNAHPTTFHNQVQSIAVRQGFFRNGGKSAWKNTDVEVKPELVQRRKPIAKNSLSPVGGEGKNL